MSYSDEVIAIELLSKSRQGKIVTNKDVDYVVFHPQEPILFIRVQGNWIKIKYEVIK